MGDVLKGKVAVVSGSGQGIGRSIAITLAGESAKVVTNNRKPGSTGFVHLKSEHYEALNQEQKDWVNKLTKEYGGDAETTAKTIKERGGEAIPFFGDISDIETAGKLIQAAVDTYGKIDILVNVAGTFGFSNIWEMPRDLWDHVVQVKPGGYFNTIRHAAPHMMAQKWGRIINCTSLSWIGDSLNHAEYAAANAGVVGLTRAAASELYEYGITCNAFSPFARTRASFELIAYNMAVTSTDLGPSLDMTPHPDGIGPMIVFLASDKAATISGSCFNISGKSVGLYSKPETVANISEPESGQWTVEEIMKRAPGIFQGYETQVVKRMR
ncbi:MAG: SDR family oxidoreductase [Dehalococcoidales bacterium]|nr:MAG: SDR family oxidoreductase [Dehalococcoidales bacterium]